MPQYAARLLRAGIAALGQDCAVVGSRPDVPVEGMEAALGRRIHWIDDRHPVTWAALGLPVPDFFFQSGWGYPGISALGREVKARGGKVIGFSDGNWRGDLRQLVLGPVGFRLLHRRHFDAMIVPGAQGRRLMRWYGMPSAAVFDGMYGADPAIFGGGPPLAERPRELLFVGQFIPRKDVLGLVAAFRHFASTSPGWRLRLVGSGAQRDAIPRAPDIVIEDFVQPEQLASRFAGARFLVLPSRVEAWGLVVHEAALSGCGLVLSDAIGSGDDLAAPDNAIRFRAGDTRSMTAALAAAGAFDAPMLARAEQESLRRGALFGPRRFARSVVAAIEYAAGASGRAG